MPVVSDIAKIGFLRRTLRLTALSADYCGLSCGLAYKSIHGDSYFTPDIRRTVGRTNVTRTTAATNATAATVPNRVGSETDS